MARKLNNRKSGAAERDKIRKREEAEERNAKYKKLSLEEKLERQVKDGKVYNKLLGIK